MGIYRFMMNRAVQSKEGKETGRIKAAVKTGSETLEGEYTCPECLKAGKVKQPFQRPIKVKCASCGHLIQVAKLKDELKKEKKKARAAEANAD